MRPARLMNQLMARQTVAITSLPDRWRDDATVLPRLRLPRTGRSPPSGEPDRFGRPALSTAPNRARDPRAGNDAVVRACPHCLDIPNGTAHGRNLPSPPGRHGDRRRSVFRRAACAGSEPRRLGCRMAGDVWRKRADADKRYRSRDQGVHSRSRVRAFQQLFPNLPTHGRNLVESEIPAQVRNSDHQQ